MRIRKIYSSLDAIRGLAALLIVLRHANIFFGSISFQESYLAVDLFFVLSGFVLGNAYDERLSTVLGGGSFLLLRLARLYPLYLIGLICAIVAELFSTQYGIHSMSMSLLIHLGLIALFMMPTTLARELYPLNPPAWSLLFELLANFAYGLLARRINIRRLQTAMAVSAAGLMLCVTPALLHTHHASLDGGFTSHTSLYGVFRVLYSFTAGLLIYRSRRAYIPRKYAGWTLAGVIGMVLALLTATPPPNVRFCYDLVVVLVLFPVLTTLAISSEQAANGNRYFSFLGVTSYGVYILHSPLSHLIAILLQAWAGVDVAKHAPFSGIAFLMLLLAVCWALEKFVDLPVRRYFGKRFGSPSKEIRVQQVEATIVN